MAISYLMSRKLFNAEICSISNLPSLEDLLRADRVPHISFDATFEAHRSKPWVYLHTSGSTGNPKLVQLKHGFFCAHDAFSLLPVNEAAERFGGQRIFSPFPPFHVVSFLYSLVFIFALDCTVVLPPAGVPLTPELIHTIHIEQRVEHCMLAPSLIIEMAQPQKHLGGFGKLKGLTFAGGPLGTRTAETVNKYTRPASGLGATEYGAIPMMPKDDEDWQYFRFNGGIGHIDWRETGNPGLYELVFVRNPAIELLQSVFVTFPDMDEYHTKDCLSKHPTKSGLWKYESRIDDILILSKGENVNLVPMEGTISSCFAIKGCLVVGQGQFQTSLLVESKDPKSSL